MSLRCASMNHRHFCVCERAYMQERVLHRAGWLKRNQSHQMPKLLPEVRMVLRIARPK